MFKTCPLTGDGVTSLDVVENDPRQLECMQGWHSGTEEGGTRSCSLSIYTTGRVVFTMDAESLEIPAGKLELSRFVNHISEPFTSDAYHYGLSAAYFKSAAFYADDSKSLLSRVISVSVVTDERGLAYAEAADRTVGGSLVDKLGKCVFH